MMLGPTHDCRDHIIYNVAGEFFCLHQDHNNTKNNSNDGVYFFTDFNFTALEIANTYYEAWNKPSDPNHDHDKSMKKHFEECMENNIHYHKLKEVKVNQ